MKVTKTFKGYAIRHLGTYRNDVHNDIERLQHEVFHIVKERSAEYVSRIDDYNYYLFKGISLVYSSKNIRHIYTGDVWTVRVKTNPLKVRRTGYCNTYKGYDECIVTGKPFGIIINPELLTKQIRLFCKQQGIKIFQTNNL